VPRPRISRKSLLGLGALLFAVSTAQTWWADRYDDRLGSSVAALAAPGDIRMVSSENCAICQLARQWLVEHQVPFQECLIERDSACKATLDASGALGTPLFLIRGRQQLGFNAEAMKRALEPNPSSKNL
jgi:glutaredoxin